MTSSLKVALSEYRQHRVQLSQIEQILSQIKSAYLKLDDARAKLEDAQTDLRDLDVPLFDAETTDLDNAIDEWLIPMHSVSEDILDWTGRDD
jgi:exonuclease VII small subunit